MNGFCIQQQLPPNVPQQQRGKPTFKLNNQLLVSFPWAGALAKAINHAKIKTKEEKTIR